MSGQARWDGDVALPSARSDRPVTLSHRAEAAAAEAVMRWSKRKGIEAASDRLGALARKAGPRLAAVHKRGRENIERALPALGAEAREAALADEWENLGRTVAEYAHLDALFDRTRIVGRERIERLAEEGGQAVFVSGHFANWEAMAIALHRLGLKTAVVYRPANNPLVDETIIRLRAQAMTRVLLPKGKRGGRELLGAVKKGLSPCLLTDQRLSDGVEATLLGRPALTAPAAARMALRADLPVVPLQIVRLPGVRFELTVHEPLDVARTGDTQADTLALTQAINDRLGDFIRETPGQWLWFHRRWKPLKR